MTDTPKRRRGRPRGTGKDRFDMPVLEQVADMMVADSKLKQTTAIKQVLARTPHRDMESTIVRRLQGKWKIHSGSLLTDARKRREASTARSVPVRRQLTATELMAREVNRMLDLQSKAEQAMKPYHSSLSEAMRVAMAHQEQMNAAMKAAGLDIYGENSALQRAVREANRFQDMIRNLRLY
jgi:hypothetical protein